MQWRERKESGWNCFQWVDPPVVRRSYEVLIGLLNRVDCLEERNRKQRKMFLVGLVVSWTFFSFLFSELTAGLFLVMSLRGWYGGICVRIVMIIIFNRFHFLTLAVYITLKNVFVNCTDGRGTYDITTKSTQAISWLSKILCTFFFFFTFWGL